MQPDFAPYELLRRMDAAFASVPYPGDDQLLEHDCPAGRHLLDGLRGRPPEAIPDDLVEHHYDGLSLLTSEARRYYLSAWVRTSLRRPESDVAEFLLYALSGDLSWQLTGGFTSCQRAVVVAFLEFLPSRLGGVFAGMIDDALTRWRSIVPVRRFDWPCGQVGVLSDLVVQRGPVPELPAYLEPLELPLQPTQLTRLEAHAGVFPELKLVFA